MEAQLILSLISTFGPPAINLVTGLIAKAQTNGIVTADEWATLTASLNISAQDRMRANLVAAGIDLSSPQAVSLLALAK